MPPESPAPWGKRRTDGREQSLAQHCRDVAAIFVALLRLPGIRGRLARLAGCDDLLESWIARFGWFAFMHDLGKTNAGFQARRDPAAPAIGHVRPIGDAWDFVLAGIGADKIAAWAGADGRRLLEDLLHAVLSHHGRPWCEDVARCMQAGRRGPGAKYWAATPVYNPGAELQRLSHAAAAQFPAAFADGPALPLSAPLIHALAGLTMLADWIASSDWESSPSSKDLAGWAAARLVAIGLDPAPWRGALAARELDFAAAFGFAPTPAQAAFATATGALAILESETGSGKTEAALWRFVERFRGGAVDGLYFALPTRTAAVQLHRRIAALVARLWPDDPPPVVLAVPGYLDEAGGGALPMAADPTDGSEEDARTAPLWAAEHPKRYFTALIGVGTVDQALLAVLRTKHAHLRGAALMRLMLVIDEVHASDAYGQALVAALLADHLAAGGEAALLSATLGASARCRYTGAAPVPSLACAKAAPYPALTAAGGLQPIPAAGQEKIVALALAEMIADPAAIAERAVAAAQDGAKVLVVRNTVANAVAVQKALEAVLPPDSPLLFRVAGVPTLHHGRFAREDRRLLDDAVAAALGKTRPDGGLVVVGTQTLEQSLDIDADYLITDLCPVDVLLQRLGRLHRHGGRRRPARFAAAQALVLSPAGGLGALLDGRTRGHGLGPGRDAARGVYPDLIALEATRRLCGERPRWTIPAMNRDLVETALHPEARAALVAAQPAAMRAAWQQHLNALEGVRFADGSFARQGTLRRDKPFMDRDNSVRPDEIIATRLGDAGILLDLPPGSIGPFAQPIRRLALPGWWGVRAVDSMAFKALEGGIAQLEIGTLRLSYQRWGLMKAEP